MLWKHLNVQITIILLFGGILCNRCGSPLNTKLTLSQWFSKEIGDETRKSSQPAQPGLPLPEWQGNYS